MFSGKTIFIAPLDWGLGHATRCVPVIRSLEKENKILLGVTPLTKKIFNEEFPLLEKISIPAYNIRYSGILPLWLKLLLDWPRIRSVIKKEHQLVEEMVRQHKIDVVISDSRFGFFSKQVHSVFITHQLFLKAPLGNRLAQWKNKKYILNFNEVWIPDYERDSESLSGSLSHGKQFHPIIKYIGPQTRLQKINPAIRKYDYLFLLSGPEPQHGLFRELLAKKAAEAPLLKFVMVSNAPSKVKCDNMQTVMLPDKKRLSELIAESDTVVCRSGYSTLMDLHLFGKKKIILVPTPGQTEQEYLAAYWKEKFKAVVINQAGVSKTRLHPAQ